MAGQGTKQGKAAAQPQQQSPRQEQQPPSEQAAPAEPQEDEAEALAKVLCAANGERPDSFRMGVPRWHGYLFAARQHIAAFEFLAASRGLELERD